MRRRDGLALILAGFCVLGIAVLMWAAGPPDTFVLDIAVGVAGVLMFAGARMAERSR